MTWTIECEVTGSDVRGPHIQGRPGDRFIYLNWGSVDGDGRMDMFRRAKLMLDGVPAKVLAQAAKTGLLIGQLDSPTPRVKHSARPCGHRSSDWSVG